MHSDWIRSVTPPGIDNRSHHRSMGYLQMEYSERGLECERLWMSNTSDEKYVTGETLMEAFNHTLLADVGRRNYSRNTELSRGGAINWELLDKDKGNMNASERRKQSWMMIDMRAVTFGRRLFRTSRGFIGLGPAACSLDDDVCVLFGGQVLYVLKEQSDTKYEFIGECYLHGMMDGQALEDESFSKRQFIPV